MAMRIVTAREIDRLVTVASLVDALREAFRGDIVTPMRHHHEVGEGAGHATHLLMPAWTADAPGRGAFLGTKIVNIFPSNGANGLPAVLGTYLLMSGETGAPLAAIDGTRLTHRRTAAASALASSYLSRPDASRLTMVGAGALSPFLVRAHADQRPIRSVTIWNHRPEKAVALADELSREGFNVGAEADLAAAVSEADIVSCATLAHSPLIEGAWLKPGTHLDLVGAFNKSMREADDEALRRGSLFVDTEAALTEGGDVALALESGAIEPPHVLATLRELCRGGHPGRRRTDEITVFKSVGTAIEDLAAAMLVWHLVTP
jgi:ornithine cyclodeaminase/alanine dehydrogenase-like protein (mu-crystallin family)